MSKFLFFIVILCFVQSAAAQKQYKIIYNVLEDREKDNYEIYSMNMDGTGQKNITNTPGVEWVYYAYKDKVYYISDKDTCHRCYFLYEMDAEGNNKRKLSDLQLEDSWMCSRNNGAEMIVLGRIGKLRAQLNGADFMFSLPNEHILFEKPYFTGSFYINTNNVYAWWKKLKDKCKVCYLIETLDYGMRQFGVYDINGYMVQFGLPDAI